MPKVFSPILAHSGRQVCDRSARCRSSKWQ